MAATLDHRACIVARLALVLLLSSLVGACTSLPPRGSPPPPSKALSATEDTLLARVASASRPSDAEALSGFRLLPTGEYAFNARLALARLAERSLDVQSYHIHRDQAGHLLLRALRDAAQRGVRVRLLVDDLYAPPIADMLAGLSAYPNVEVRLFNPMPLRSGPPLLRLLLPPGGFEQHNHRMHNKLFIADNQMAVYGGRNIADEYFMTHPEANFIDMDVLSTGPVVRDLSRAFDRYWNSEVVWPLHAWAAEADAQTLRTAFDAAVQDTPPVVPDYALDPLGQPPVEDQLARGRLVLVHAAARVHVDPPEKALDHGLLRQPTAAMQGLLDAISTAQREVAIVSPYFVPGDVGMGMMRRASEAGVTTTLFTNSLGSTDEPLVHEHYSRYRAEMLRIGVAIYEFSPQGTQRSRGFGNFGRSTPRLHAKVAMVDGRKLLVGSVNLDPRSAIGNTELGVVIESPPLALSAAQLMSSDQFASMYRLRLASDGRVIVWTTAGSGGEPEVAVDEPGRDAWTRFKLWLQSLFVEERLL